MDQQLNQWKLTIERFAAAAAPDFREVALLVGKIAETSANKTLRQAASQALPSLRNAAAWSADQAIKDIARRRLGLFMEAMHTLAAPRFGRRDVPARKLTAEEQYRRLLGLPLDRRLAATEIHQAFKRAAKTMHPDAGGDARQFQELSVARDALMKAK
jgi:hypothetical protein